MGALEHWYHDLVREASRLGVQEWTAILAAVVVVGILCLRGFGSRSHY